MKINFVIKDVILLSARSNMADAWFIKYIKLPII